MFAICKREIRSDLQGDFGITFSRSRPYNMVEARVWQSQRRKNRSRAFKDIVGKNLSEGNRVLAEYEGIGPAVDILSTTTGALSLGHLRFRDIDSWLTGNYPCLRYEFFPHKTITGAVQLSPYIQKIFEKVSGRRFLSYPDDNGDLYLIDVNANIAVHVLQECEFEEEYRRSNKEGKLPGAFARNSNDTRKLKHVYLRRKVLKEEIMDVGHELGHVVTENLPNEFEEEAKARAFEHVWYRTIQDHWFDGLGREVSTYREADKRKWPVHYEVYKLIDELVETSRDPFSIYRDIINGEMTF